MCGVFEKMPSFYLATRELTYHGSCILCCLLNFFPKLHLSSHHFSGWSEYKTTSYQTLAFASACSLQSFFNGEIEQHAWKIFKIHNFLSLQWSVCTISNFRITMRRMKHTQPEGKMFPLVFHFCRNCIKKSFHVIYQKENRNIKVDLHTKYEDQTLPSSSAENQCRQFQHRQLNYTMLFFTKKCKLLLLIKNFTVPNSVCIFYL